jgi:hypothetical protein
MRESTTLRRLDQPAILEDLSPVVLPGRTFPRSAAVEE